MTGPHTRTHSKFAVNSHLSAIRTGPTFNNIRTFTGNNTTHTKNAHKENVKSLTPIEKERERERAGREKNAAPSAFFSSRVRGPASDSGKITQDKGCRIAAAVRLRIHIGVLLRFLRRRRRRCVYAPPCACFDFDRFGESI